MWISMTHLASRCLFLLVLCTNIYAEPSIASKMQSITLDEAITRTLLDNPQLLAFGYQLDIKRGRVQQASVAPIPELLVTVEDALGTGEYQGFSKAQTTVSLGWTFERTLRERRTSAALASESLFTDDNEILRVDAAAETARRFLALMAHQARAVTADEAVTLAEESVEVVRQRVEVGRAPDADLARAQAALAFALLAQDDIEHQLKSARHRLAAQWGSTLPDFEKARGDPFILPVTLPFQKLKQQTEQNPQMSRFLTRQRLDEAELRLAEAQRKPGWKGLVGVRRYETTDDFALVAAFTLPLATRNSNQGRVTQARAVIEQTHAESIAAKVDIETTLYVFYEALQHSIHRAESLRNDVLPRMESALAETRSAYERGRYSFFEWQSLQAQLIEMQNMLIEASIDAHLNVIEIERLTGVGVANAGTTP